jgi:tetratricopeptide (TPR) repeat protein
MDKNVRREAAAQPEEKKTLSDKVGEVIRKNRKIILIALGVVAAIVLIILVWTGVSSSRVRGAAKAFDAADKAWTTWQSESDQTKKDALVPDLEKQLDSLVSRYKGSYQAQQGLMMRAKMAEAAKDWEKAEGFWSSAAKVQPASYLTPIALEGAALAAEERGESAKAIEYYTSIVSSKTKAVGLAHARFSLGRLYEGTGDYAKAKSSYTDLVSNHPDSDWAVLAKNRLIFIEAGKLAP